MEIKANAKVNLVLDVVRRMENGYHELDMIMVPLSLCDILHVTIANEDKIICENNSFPLDESNTIYKAIKLMRERFNLDEHFHVEVEKNIPMQAGMAGGSADGAAMLKAIISLCNLKVEEKEMIEIAKKIGADVPFCYVNEASRVKGIGEKVRRFKIDCKFFMLLVKPEEGVSTALAFKGIDFNTCIHPDVDICEKALKENDYTTFIKSLGNTLEQSAFEITPVIKEIKKQLMELGMDGVLMSGSGSTVFAITRNKDILLKAKEEMLKQYPFVCETEIL